METKNREEIVLQKRELRRAISRKKREFSLEQLEVKSAQIISILEDSPQFLASKVILCYWSLAREVTTHDFVQRWWKEKIIVLPVIDGDQLVLKKFSGMENMAAEPSFGILEPVGEAFTAYSTIDLALIPGVAFDQNKNRLGRGKGYYDRTFSLLSADTPLWGLAYDFQIVPAVPTEEHDQKVDRVITNLSR